MEWKSEIREQLQKIKSEGQQYPQLEQELIIRRREELRSAAQLSCQLILKQWLSVENSLHWAQNLVYLQIRRNLKNSRSTIKLKALFEIST